MSPLELLQDAEKLARMSAIEQLYAGAQVAMLGMAIVFTILLILLLTVKGIEKFARNGKEALESPGVSEETQPEKTENISTAHQQEPAKNTLEGELSPEVLAAIIAALQVFYQDKYSKFRILRVSKKSKEISVWMREIETEAEAVEAISEQGGSISTYEKKI